jgi:hypothetical protein
MAEIVPYNMDLTKARDAVSNLINEPMVKQFSAEKIDSLLNQCCRSIYSKTNRVLYRARRDCEVGVGEYEIPDAFRTGVGVNIQQVFIDSTEITKGAFAPVPSTTTGTPATWAVLGDVLQLTPTPDDTYTVTIMYEKEYMPATEESPVFMVNDESVDCAILFAGYMLKIMDEEYTSGGMLRNAYEDAFARVTQVPAGIYSAKEEYEYGRE